MGLLIWAGILAVCVLSWPGWSSGVPSGRSSRTCTSTTPASCSTSSASGWRRGSSRPWARPTRRGPAVGVGPVARRGPLGARPPDPPLAGPGLRPLRARAVRPAAVPRHATALFEFRKGRWHVEGKRLDEVRPDEAVGRNQRFEAVAISPPPPPDRVGSDPHSRILACDDLRGA